MNGMRMLADRPNNSRFPRASWEGGSAQLPIRQTLCQLPTLPANLDDYLAPE
jgi:hypothetical protein